MYKKIDYTGYWIYMNVKTGTLFCSSGCYGKPDGTPFEDHSSGRWFVRIGKV